VNFVGLHFRWLRLGGLRCLGCKPEGHEIKH
jgi:hypothetical protein